MRTRFRYLVLALMSIVVIFGVGLIWDLALYAQDVTADHGGYYRYIVQVQEVWAVAAAIGVLFFLAVDRASNLPSGKVI